MPLHLINPLERKADDPCRQFGKFRRGRLGCQAYHVAVQQIPDLRRHAQLIESMIPTQLGFGPFAEVPSQIQVERGLLLPIVELPANRPIQIVDAGGHARRVYRPLLVYNWLLAIERTQAIGPSTHGINAWIESLDEGPFSSLVQATAGVLFSNPIWSANAGKFFGDLIDRQQPSGALFPEDSAANPELRWYDELIALHALASYAIRTSDQPAAQAAQRSAIFHLNETQPDHASAQPWGLLAFAQFAPAMAEQLLHALTMQYPAGVTGVPLLLLTDALYGLRRLIAEESQTATHNGPLAK